MKRFFAILLTLLLFSTVCYADKVIYNTKTQKYHSVWCQWADRCTKNCIQLERKEAVKRGGVPCKVCGAK